MKADSMFFSFQSGTKEVNTELLSAEVFVCASTSTISVPKKYQKNMIMCVFVCNSDA